MLAQRCANTYNALMLQALGGKMSAHHKHSQGGFARAEKLSPEERSAIASSAAKARWAKDTGEDHLPKATHRGEISIGDIKLPCAVLDDGRRVVSEFGITRALGSRSGASKRLKKASEEDGALVPVFLAPPRLKPFISDEILNGPLKPITYRDKQRRVVGYSAEALPAVCEIWLDARHANALQQQQLAKAQNAEILMRGLAHVGIVALVDEATGYQSERDRDELNKILSLYLADERLKWAKRFPDEFYKQIYRLKKWRWPNHGNRTPYVGKITNAIVYEKLPPGVMEELQSRNPTREGTGRRKWKHHQFLSEDIGQPDLRDHLMQLIALMRISPDWPTFELHMKLAFPARGDQMFFDLEA